MIYVYSCEDCKVKQDVYKSMIEIDRVECCPFCSKPMERNIQPIKANKTAVFESHFNYGLGKVVTSQRQVHEELARLRGETGKDIVEIGNDDLKAVKKKRHNYEDVYKELSPKY